jgi:hypothetical protein
VRDFREFCVEGSSEPARIARARRGLDLMLVDPRLAPQ